MITILYIIDEKPECHVTGFSTYVIFYPALAKTFG